MFFAESLLAKCLFMKILSFSHAQLLLSPTFSGRCLHQPGERGVRVHAGPGAGRRRGDEGSGTAGGGADLSLSVLLVHGQRD